MDELYLEVGRSLEDSLGWRDCGMVWKVVGGLVMVRGRHKSHGGWAVLCVIQVRLYRMGFRGSYCRETRSVGTL